jgi:hypothetical protein
VPTDEESTLEVGAAKKHRHVMQSDERRVVGGRGSDEIELAQRC